MQFFRQRYLALIHDLGEAKIGELKLVERLELRPGLAIGGCRR